MSYGNPNRHTDCEQFIDPTQPTIGEDVAMLVLTLQRDCDALRAQNAELLAADKELRRRFTLNLEAADRNFARRDSLRARNVELLAELRDCASSLRFALTVIEKHLHARTDLVELVSHELNETLSFIARIEAAP